MLQKYNKNLNYANFTHFFALKYVFFKKK